MMTKFGFETKYGWANVRWGRYNNNNLAIQLMTDSFEPLAKMSVNLPDFELQDREFFAAIREGREPNSSIAQVLPCYQVLHDLEQQLA